MSIPTYYQTNKKNYFVLSPRIVKAHEEAVITVRSRYVTAYPHFVLEGDYFVLVSPLLEYEVAANSATEQNPFVVTAKDGVLSFSYGFNEEQDYMIAIWKRHESGDKEMILTTFVYALEEDMYPLLPLKGNTHLHSTYSDGLEEPSQHIGMALKSGFDYIALTDHNNYEGSVQAKKYLEMLSEVYIDRQLTVLNGEEFSCNYQPMHIISLGAEEPVPKELYRLDSIPEFNSREEKLRWITERLCKLSDKVHQLGGLTVLCHPYWKPIFDWTRLDAPHSLIKSYIESGKVDAFEVVGGSPKGSSIISQQQHLLALECMRNIYRPYAFLGQSDSHIVNADDESCIFPTHYTIAFCKENTREGILDAIRNRRTVAVEETDGVCEYFGELRYVNFCRFLEKEYFPLSKNEKMLWWKVFCLCLEGNMDDGKKLADTLKDISTNTYDILRK